MLKYVFCLLFASCTLPVLASARDQAIHLGIDVLEQSGFKAVAGKRIGLLTHPAGVNRRGVSTIDILAGRQTRSWLRSSALNTASMATKKPMYRSMIKSTHARACRSTRCTGNIAGPVMQCCGAWMHW